MEKNNNESELKVDFNSTNKSLSYKGSLGDLVGNSLILLQMLYRSINNSKNRMLFKKEITKYIEKGIVFMSNEDIENAMKNLSINNGGKNNE